MKFFDMFSGIGGFHKGITQAIPDAKCIGFSDIDKKANAIYEKHFTDVKSYGDATKINTDEIADFDILCGGFPCQSFSIAGRRQGFQDIRGTLFAEIVRIAKAKRPRFLFLENVKGLLNHDGGETFATILHSFYELGYNLEWEVLNSKNFGVPQNRERVFIIGHYRKEPTKQIFPIGQSNRGGVETQGKTQAEGKWLWSEVVSCLSQRDYKGGNNLIINTVQEGGARQPKIRVVGNIYPESGHEAGNIYDTNGISPTIKCNGSRPNSNNIAPKIIERVQLTSLSRNKKDINGDYSCTIDSTQNSGINVDERIRRLTPIECERLQGFPDGWTEFGKDGEKMSDSSRYKMLGNTVTVNVIEVIAERLNEVMYDT